MIEHIEALRTNEYEDIGKAVFERLAEIVPDGIAIEYQSIEGISKIGFLTIPGGKYISRDVTGGFRAQMPFQLMYQFIATNNAQRLEAEQLLNDVCDELEDKHNYPTLSNNRTITDIAFNSTPYRSRSEQDGSIAYVRTGEVKYEKEVL